MSDMRDLYQEVILDHSRKPRNFGVLNGDSIEAVGHNPLCGDRLSVYLHVEDGVVSGIAFDGVGCAISTASASMMTEAVKGKTVEEAEKLFEAFHEMLTGDPSSEGDGSALGKLSVFAGVREYPVRVKCATLAWHTLKSALDGDGEKASTE